MSSVLQIPTAHAFLPLLKPSRYKGAHGGRGSGKSHFFAELMVEENIRQRLDNVCLRETLKSLEFSVKKLLEAKIEAMNAGQADGSKSHGASWISRQSARSRPY